MLRLALLATALILTGACTGTGSLPENAQRTVGKIGVIALMGDDLSLVHTGLTGITSNARNIRVSNWEVDQFVVDKLMQMLQERDYEVVRTTYSNSELQPIYISGAGTLDWKIERVAPQLRTISKHSGLDTLILVLRRASPDFIHLTQDAEEYYQESLVGFGLYDRRTVVSYVTTATFANLTLVAVDARTLRPIARRDAQRHTTVKQDFWHETYSNRQPELAEKDANTLRKEVESVISATLQEAAVGIRL